MRKPPFGFFEHLQKKPPKTLYHYTSLTGLKGIIETGSLFATNAAYLNDYREIHHARQMIRERAGKALLDASGDDHVCLNWLVEHLSDTPVSTYVTSFSEEGDDLSQWRGYTPSGLGVAIGFKSDVLSALVKEIGASLDIFPTVFSALGKVIYVSEGSDKSFDKFVQSAPRYMAVMDGAVAKTNFDLLIDQATPFYKHDAFKAEREWRACLVPNSHMDLPFPLEFRIGASKMIPYTTIRFSGQLKGLVAEVVVGPTPNPKLANSGVQTFIDAHGLTDTVVRSSAIPYRSW